MLARFQFPVLASAHTLSVNAHDLAWQHFTHTVKDGVTWRLYHFQDLAQAICTHFAWHERIESNAFGSEPKITPSWVG